jgi:hypothetical protein
MKNVALVSVVAVALLSGLAGCGHVEQPTAPTAAPPVTSPPPVSTSDAFPPISGPARIFDYSAPVSRVVTSYTPRSRFVLYDDRRFALQYGSLGIEYRGTYRESGSEMTFEWEGWSAAGPWGATGELSGDVLTVRYNLIMQLTDFEDAVYALSR